MVAVANSFDGGSSGSIITTGNSGGASGDAFQSILGSPLYNAANALHGANAGAFDPAASATCYVAHTTTMGTLGTVYGRAYFMFPSLPAAAQTLMGVYDSVAGLRARASILTDGRIRLIDSGGGTLTTSSGVGGTVVAGSWFRLEVQFTGDPTTGTADAILYLSPESTSPSSTLHASLANTGGTFTSYRVGQFSTTATDLGVFYVDEIAWDSAGYPGPFAALDKEVDLSQIDNTYTMFAPDSFATAFSRKNHFDSNGQVDGTNISTANSDANSDQWDAVTLGGVGTVKYNTANAVHGARAGAFDPDAAHTAYTQWNLSSGIAEVYGRLYVKYTTLPGNTSRLVTMRDNAGAADRGSLQVQTDGRVRLVDAAGTTVATSPNDATGILVAGSTARIEWHWTGNASSGLLECKLFISNAEGTTADSTTTATSINTGGTIDRFRFGQANSAAADTAVFYMDEIELSAAGYIGKFVAQPQTVTLALLDNTYTMFQPNVMRLVELSLLDNTYTIFAPTQVIKASNAKTVSLPLITTVGQGWGQDWGRHWGGRSYTMFEPSVQKLVSLSQIDNTYTIYAPRIAGQTATLPLLDNSYAMFTPVQVKMSATLPQIDNTYTMFDLNQVTEHPYQVTLPLIDNTYTSYAPRVNPYEIDLPLLDNTYEMFQPTQVKFTVTLPLLDNTYTINTPQSVIRQGRAVGLPQIDNTYTAYAPNVMRMVGLTLTDNTYTIYDPLVTEAISNEVDLLFIDNQYTMFDPVSVTAAADQDVALPLLDNGYTMLAPRFYNPLISGVFLDARYNPTVYVNARYNPTVYLDAREDR